MLDLARLDRVSLARRPPGQWFMANALLGPNYGFLPGVRIDLEGLQGAEREPVIFAMNHTDRYNYWPFQYALYRRSGRFCATWVKGKYYENAAVAAFMQSMNNLPTVSRGYLIAKDFVAAVGRKPTDAEYERLRARVDAVAGVRVAPGDPGPPEGLPAALFTRPRSMLGRPFDPTRERWEDAICALFAAMMARFVRLNEEARDIGNDLLIFPQGTRSRRLSRGHIGLAQIALHLRIPVHPVGCSGSDRVYPGSSPVARRGHIVYRIGPPLTVDDLDRYRPEQPFVPFSAEAERAHRDRFQALVDDVMARIEPLVDPPYRFATALDSDGVTGTDRFV